MSRKNDKKYSKSTVKDSITTIVLQLDDHFEVDQDMWYVG